MEYVNPSEVISPKNKISQLKVLYDGQDHSFSLASFLWEGVLSLGIRWNGFGENIGNPVSRGYPTWFVIPHELEKAVLDECCNLLEDPAEQVFIGIIMEVRKDLGKNNGIHFQKNIHLNDEQLSQIQTKLHNSGIQLDLTKENIMKDGNISLHLITNQSSSYKI